MYLISVYFDERISPPIVIFSKLLRRRGCLYDGQSDTAAYDGIHCFYWDVFLFTLGAAKTNPHEDLMLWELI